MDVYIVIGKGPDGDDILAVCDKKLLADRRKKFFETGGYEEYAKIEVEHHSVQYEEMD